MSAARKTAPKKAVAKKAPAKRAARPLGDVVDTTAALAREYADRLERKAAKRGKARERESFYREMHGPIDHAALAASMAAMAFPNTDTTQRWVPIGPTVNRRGQAMSRPRTSGRIRDIAVSPDGTRGYAISAKGGVWYTGDAGITWAPVGGWAGRSVNPQGNGNMFTGGSLLVQFVGNTAAVDVVMVGTGEATPWITAEGSSGMGGIGVLVGLGPATAGIADDPWEADTGAAALSGRGIYRLARHPSASPLSISGPSQDRVLAATSSGLFLGTRAHQAHVPAAPPPGPGQPPQPDLPERDGFTWAALPCQTTGVVTDVLWLVNGPNTRIVYAVDSSGVFFSDDGGTTSNPVPTINASAFGGRISLALVPTTNRVYVVAEVNSGGPPPPNNPTLSTPTLWQIANVLAATPVGVVVPGVPTDLFGGPTQPTQGDYDQAIAVEANGVNDRIYLGGSTVKPRSDAEGEWSASLWCFETPSAAPAALTPAAGVSRRQNPPTGDGGDRDGLIGNNVHADVHIIRLSGAAIPNRSVWVGCDGGVYVSHHSGRVNTFGSRNTGLATLEPIFLGNHPTSSHFMIIGLQDNGSQIRVGDTVWESTFKGDGGGSGIHPINSDIVITQYVNGRWNGAPAGTYFDPLTRHSPLARVGGREETASAWASGVAVIADTATTARIALGTNRVWINDHMGDGQPNRWRTLPWAAGTERDTRPNGTDATAQQGFGVPVLTNANFQDSKGNSTAEQVIDLVWQTGTDLLVMYRGGLVRYTNTKKAAGTWTTASWPLTSVTVAIPTTATLTAVATVPGSLDFYVATLGDAADTTVETLWFFDNANTTFHPTTFRHHLDFKVGPVDGPLDPVFAVVVDPVTHADVYVGTATGVWKGTKTGATTWSTFSEFANGLPQATVQDLRIWQDPAAGADSPRLLRAAVQSRGVWEVDLAHPHIRRTYVRVHARDDRRMLPTPMANPRRRPTAPVEPVFASPDIVVRPQWPRAVPPVFHSTISSGKVKTYDLWTFQTAFRWLYPSCVPDGQWSDAMRDLVRFHRQVLGLPPGAFIDATMWQKVVGTDGIRLLADPANSSLATVTTGTADPLAVYRAPWQTTSSFDGFATEIDLMECVLPTRNDADEWVVFKEPSTVDVLLHHRDSRQVASGSAFAVLLWRSAPTQAALLATGFADLVPYLAAAIAAPLTTPPTGPAGWNVATDTNGAAMRTLLTTLDARLPRAVSIDVDLSGVTSGHRVMFLALVGSTVDDAIVAPAGVVNNLSDLVRGWEPASIRIVKVVTRA